MPKKRLGEVLQELELVDEDRIREALKIQREKGGLIGEILVTLGYVSQEEVQLALAVGRGAKLGGLEELET
ncbi:MAG TPA: hypothetical protein VF950_00735 [Planctomycetota bacterium]